VNQIALAIYFLFAPPLEILELSQPEQLIIARNDKGYLRWFGQGREAYQDGKTSLASFRSPTRLVADFREEGLLRITISPNEADNAVLYGPFIQQIFVNGRKLSCRQEGDLRRIFYPVLNNREPCER